ncbi:flavodoxin family protein [Candidatus Aerophobetes bacterium]|nr:flavodoxin family protein [Candidatus Aerophobetes bacterium]
MEKHILIIYGSPREGGNTDTLLAEVLKGVRRESKNISIEEVYLRKLSISHCQECRVCERKGKCVINDDMQSLHEKLWQADYIVLASPIFFYSVSSLAKCMIDRCQTLWARRYILKRHPDKQEEERGGWFVSVGATRGRNLFEGAILTVKYFFDAAGVPYRGDLLVRGVDEKGEIQKQKEILSSAYNLGRKIAALS